MKKASGRRRHFLHWYKTEFGRMVVYVVGDAVSAVRDVKRYFGSKDSAPMVDAICSEESRFWEENGSGGLTLSDCGRVMGIDTCLSVMWFPVIPSDKCLVHELLHCVQNISAGAGINDREFDAYMLEALFQFFKEKKDADARVGLEKRK